MVDPPPNLAARLRAHGQTHLLDQWACLDATARERYVEQLAGVDFAKLERLYRKRNDPHDALPPRDRIEPVPVEPRTTAAVEIGENAIRRGEVAALVVAGGQATRLGTDRPKGEYPVGPVSGASLFQLHAEKVLALRRRYEARIPYLVMTSPATHDDTVEYFAANLFFGLPSDSVTFFQQGTMPAIDLATGRVLLEAPGRLCLSPNGHGGCLTALADSGLLAKLKADGVRHLFYFQVDNPLVKVADPAFVGRHVETRSEVSSKIIAKTDPAEKVGVLGLVDGRCSILEYSDLPPAMANERTETGDLVFRAGSPAIHLFALDFLERITSGPSRLDYHLAKKKVNCLDDAGRPSVPTTENALKFELFIFDALPLAECWLVVEVRREDEFAPLKNAIGTDSPATVRKLLIDRAARWLESAGVQVPRENGESKYPLEIGPLFALDEAELRSKIAPALKISERFLLDH